MSEKLLFILHVGYAWLVLGGALLGLSIFNTGVPVASVIHALTAGADDACGSVDRFERIVIKIDWAHDLTIRERA
jgi:hypothetical protein